MQRFHFQPGAVYVEGTEQLPEYNNISVTVAAAAEGYLVFDGQRGNTDGTEIAFCERADDASMIASALNALVRPKPKASAILTPRQLEAARLLTQGMERKEIAHVMQLERMSSVHRLLSEVSAAIGAKGRTHMVLALLDWDLS